MELHCSLILDFGISCTEGNLPTTEKEIAISYLLAKEIQKTIGEKISIEVNSKFYDYTICGIYQDITNGGKSAKVSDKEIDAAVYRSVININLLNSEKKLMEITDASSNRDHRQPGVKCGTKRLVPAFDTLLESGAVSK